MNITDAGGDEHYQGPGGPFLRARGSLTQWHGPWLSAGVAKWLPDKGRASRRGLPRLVPAYARGPPVHWERSQNTVKKKPAGPLARRSAGYRKEYVLNEPVSTEYHKPKN